MMAKTAYTIKILVLTVSEGEPRTIMAGHMAVGRRGAGAKAQGRESRLTGNPVGF